MTDPFAPPPDRDLPPVRYRQIRAAVLQATRPRRSRRRPWVLAALVVGIASVVALIVGVSLPRVSTAPLVAEPTTAAPVPPTPPVTSSPSASARPSSAPPDQPEVMARQAMTASQIRRDTATCLALDRSGGDPPPRRGALRTRYAFVQPVITDRADDTRGINQRVLFLQDELGQYQCTDGVQDGWQSLASEGFEPTAEIPGGEVPGTGGATSASCGAVQKSAVESHVLLSVDERSVAAARTTLLSDRRVVRVVDLPVDGPDLYVGVRFAGEAARRPMSYRVELLDDRDRVLAVQPYGAAGTGAARRLSYQLRSCADAEADLAAHQPEPPTRPRSDRAGVTRCLAMAEEDGDQGLDVEQAEAEVVISTREEWGAVLSDGRHHLGCSLYPTQELSAAAPVTEDPATDERSFHWATNPIIPDGESLWASGHLPGATRITYRLPDGSTARASISPDGYWMVKARTPTAFDREDDAADWEPVRITVVRSGRTTIFTVPWTERSMCNQISHGC